MRSIGFVTLAAVLAFASGADAQSRMGRKNDGNPQSTPGYDDVKKAEEKKFPLGASWIAVSLNGKAYGGTERPAFSMDDQFRVRGFSGCNSFTASAFPLREQGIAVGPLALTGKNCDKGVMAAETAFLTALRTSAKWDTQIGSLVIKGPNGEIKFERAL